MATMGSYFADLAKNGKLNEVNNEELQDIMKKQAESLGFSGVEITVTGTKSEPIQEDELLNSWTEEDEEKAQNLLNKLSSEPHFEERMELGKFLMRHIDDLSEEERKRYDELLEILDSEYKIEKIDIFKDENRTVIENTIQFLKYLYRRIDKGDSPEEILRMFLVRRKDIESIILNSDSNE